VVHGQEFHTSYWGHLGVLGIHGNMLLPGYAGYPNTRRRACSTNADVADIAHAQGALSLRASIRGGNAAPDQACHTDADELPVDVALGKIDYLESSRSPITRRRPACGTASST